MALPTRGEGLAVAAFPVIGPHPDTLPPLPSRLRFPGRRLPRDTSPRGGRFARASFLVSRVWPRASDLAPDTGRDSGGFLRSQRSQHFSLPAQIPVARMEWIGAVVALAVRLVTASRVRCLAASRVVK